MFINNTSLLYIPVHLQVLMIMHVISIISCSFNIFFIAFGVLLTLVLRTCNTFHPLKGTCKIFVQLFLCIFDTLNVFHHFALF